MIKYFWHGCSSNRHSDLCRDIWSSFRLVTGFLVPNFFHFMIIEPTDLLGTFKASEKVLYPFLPISVFQPNLTTQISTQTNKHLCSNSCPIYLTNQWHVFPCQLIWLLILFSFWYVLSLKLCWSSYLLPVSEQDIVHDLEQFAAIFKLKYFLQLRPSLLPDRGNNYVSIWSKRDILSI